MKMLCFLLFSFFSGLLGNEITVYEIFGNEIPQNEACTSPFIQVGSYCYYFSNSKANKLNWYQAKQTCQTQYHGLLAMLDTQDKINVVTAYVQKTYPPSDEGFWISGNNNGNLSEWIWDPTSASIKYFNWHKGEPNNNHGVERCLNLYGANVEQFLWNDGNCFYPLSYICQTVPSSCHGCF